MRGRLRFLCALLLFVVGFVWVSSGGRLVDTRAVVGVFVAATLAAVVLPS